LNDESVSISLVYSYSKVIHYNLYITNTPFTMADLLNDKRLSIYQINDTSMYKRLIDGGIVFSIRWRMMMISIFSN